MYGISRRTLYNIRSHYNMTGAEFSAFTQISDEDLKQAIREVKLFLPKCGQSMIRGILNSQGIYVPTTRRSCEYSSTLGYPCNEEGIQRSTS